ncbi:sulfite exporter TauE/SafE family protein [Solidesulfovibrio sp.]|uniref:sulfite exporter TauE/SafE family protein n=1 Tax=Solidesulfovibrio sp. TaxID=2910990 RepID=UPI00262CDB99|nr:sulfite exporter TauE/SafE family protein [Solidesulfovibrio sp.]
MSAFVAVCATALVASGLTLFSGFGLGTILTPVMAVFFPIEAAVAMTALVHFANNLFKLSLFAKKADRRACLRFGLPAVAASFVGAAVLLWLADLPALARYTLFGRDMVVTPVKLVVGLLIGGFSVLEITHALKGQGLPPGLLPLGGLVSGFFGGLSGHQGAFRSAFLLRLGLSKEAFIATGVFVACMVDATRLTVYAAHLGAPEVAGNLGLLAAATVCAFAGAFAGARLLGKMTIDSLHRLVGALLLALSALLAAGVL